MKKNILKTIGFIVILLAVSIITSKTYGYYELIGFDDKHIYEARIYYKNLHEIEQSIEENQIEIESLIGKNGIINKKEFLDF